MQRVLQLLFSIKVEKRVMVKNKKGGKGGKKFARKHVKGDEKQREKIRFPVEEGEMFAKTLKVFGNGRFQVLCNDNVERMMIMRKRFMKRNKMDNMVNIGTYVLVGTRDWEVLDTKKTERVDLLYVYSKGQNQQIKEHADFSEKLLDLDKTDEDLGIEFCENDNKMSVFDDIDYGDEKEGAKNEKVDLDKKTIDELLEDI